MILESVLDGVWSKSTLSKKIKEVSTEMTIDFSQNQTIEIIREAVEKLLPKSRGQAKTSLEEILIKLESGDASNNPSWESKAGITIDSVVGKRVEKKEVEDSVEISDIDILKGILLKMGVNED